MNNIRKIMSRENKEKKDQRNKTILSILLAAILLFSTAGYFVMDFTGKKAESIQYSNLEFKKTDSGYWQFNLNGQDFATLYNPLETQNISKSILTSLYDYANQPLYFSAMPIEEIPGSTQEIMRNIGSLTLRNNYACLNNSCSQDYAVKNCSTDNVIIYQKSSTNQTLIVQEEKCIKIIYAEGDSERASDAFLFKILGIQ